MREHFISGGQTIVSTASSSVGKLSLLYRLDITAAGWAYSTYPLRRLQLPPRVIPVPASHQGVTGNGPPGVPFPTRWRNLDAKRSSTPQERLHVRLASD